MQLPQRLARFNRHVTNPIQRMWAGWLPGFAILEHVGRRSGVTEPRTVTKAEAAAHVSAGSRRIFARLPFEQAVLLKKTD